MQVSWFPPCGAVMNLLEEACYGKKVLEVGAGNGFWGAVMKTQGGVDIKCTDPRIGDDVPDASAAWPAPEPLTAAEALQKYPDREVLLMMWPTYDSTWAEEALRAFKGDTFVYAGEGPDGMTGTDELYTEMYSTWKEVKYVSTVRWCKVCGTLTVFKRRDTLVETEDTEDDD